MKKLATLFSDSYAELKQVKTITTMAMFAAISVILGYFTIAIGDYIKIGFSTIANQFVYYLFGPVSGGFFGGALDILKYLVKPTGAYFPGFTLNAILAGGIYGILLYKKPVTFKRILLAEFLVALICNVILGTFWLKILYGKSFMVLLPIRAFKNLLMWPINAMLFYSIVKAMETAGITKMIRGRKLSPGK
ncbi:MAG: folate family ECF transporter S component [Hungatella sp.]